MNDVKEVAKAYYNGAKDEEKELARKLFQSLDPNCDGKVSLEEYRRLVNPFFSNEQIFRHLDDDGDGTLDFEEVLALYYMDRVSIPRCGACHDMLLASYFSCSSCRRAKTSPSYCLCCGCYGGAKFNHHHPSNEFADTRTLLKLLDSLVADEAAAAGPGVAEIRSDNIDGNGKTEESTASPATSTAADNIAATLNALDSAIYLGQAAITLGNEAVNSGCSIM